MRLVDDRSEGLLQIRVVECDCTDDDGDLCGAYFMLARCTNRADLWLACGWGRFDDVVGQVRFMLADLPAYADGERPSQMVDRGVALIGLSWDDLMQSPAHVAAQSRAWQVIPGWMDALPPMFVWRMRGIAHGGPLTRVPRALAALDGYYQADRPVRVGEWSP